MKKKKVLNLHCTASVVLTPQGRARYEEYCRQELEEYEKSLSSRLTKEYKTEAVNERRTFLASRVDAKGRFRTVLYEIMHIFGPNMYVGGDQLFQKHAITIEEIE